MTLAERKARLLAMKKERAKLERDLNELNYLILDEEQVIAIMEQSSSDNRRD